MPLMHTPDCREGFSNKFFVEMWKQLMCQHYRSRWEIVSNCSHLMQCSWLSLTWRAWSYTPSLLIAILSRILRLALQNPSQRKANQTVKIMEVRVGCGCGFGQKAHSVLPYTCPSIQFVHQILFIFCIQSGGFWEDLSLRPQTLHSSASAARTQTSTLFYMNTSSIGEYGAQESIK